MKKFGAEVGEGFGHPERLKLRGGVVVVAVESLEVRGTIVQV